LGYGLKEVMLYFSNYSTNFKDEDYKKMANKYDHLSICIYLVLTHLKFFYIVSLLEYMEAADYQLQNSLTQDLDDYLNEVENIEKIWMIIFIVVIALLVLLIFIWSLFRRFKEIEIMNFVLNKLALTSKGK